MHPDLRSMLCKQSIPSAHQVIVEKLSSLSHVMPQVNGRKNNYDNVSSSWPNTYQRSARVHRDQLLGLMGKHYTYSSHTEPHAAVVLWLMPAGLGPLSAIWMPSPLKRDHYIHLKRHCSSYIIIFNILPLMYILPSWITWAKPISFWHKDFVIIWPSSILPTCPQPHWKGAGYNQQNR